MSDLDNSEPTRRGKSARDPRLYYRTLVVLLAVSALTNVLLSLKSFQLYQQAKQLSRTVEQLSGSDRAQIGDVVPPIAAMNLKGEPAWITYTGTESPTILYVFSPQCVWCDRNLKSVKSLAAQTSNHYRFLSLTLSEVGLSQYIIQNDIQFPVYNRPSREALSPYKITGTPQTFVISPDGHIVENWTGAYAGDARLQVERFFNIELPEATSR